MEAQKEVSKLNKRLFMERVNKKRERVNPDIENRLAEFTDSNVIRKIGVEEILEGSPSSIRRSFDILANELPRGYIEDLESLDYFDSGLTASGVRFLRQLAIKSPMHNPSFKRDA